MAFGLLKMFKYPGGQSLMASRIMEILPEHDTYVEPFVGGGTVFFAKADKMPARKNILGDTNCRLIRFYDLASKGGLRKCHRMVNMKQPEAVARARKIIAKRPTGPYTVCEFLLIQKVSFSGNFSSPHKVSFPRRTDPRASLFKNVLGRLNLYEDALKGTTAICGSFDKTMARYDSPKTLHYLDPPYPETEVKYHGGHVTPERVKSVCDRMRGKVIISYNNIPSVTRVFCGPKSKWRCNCSKSKKTIGVESNGKRQTTEELLITNFDTRLPNECRIQNRNR